MREAVMDKWNNILSLSLSSAAFAAKCDEYRHEARRCRQIVKTIMEKSDVNGVAVEFYTETRIHGSTGAGFGIVLCAPGLDETNFTDPAKEIVGWYLDRLGVPSDGYNVGKNVIRGTEGDDA